MWKDYSTGFLKKNRASSLSVVIASFISALFLSLLCCLFFNFRNYEMEQIVLEEGDWQGRITGTFDEDDISVIQNFANVKKAGINQDLSDHQNTVVDIYFQNMGTIYHDMPLIAKKLEVPDHAVSYHDLLLSKYLIHDPQDAEPPLLLTFYLIILILVSASLILIIHNSFAVSMNARVHQFGIFSSIGATPGQIRTCLLQEAAALCIVPVLAGSFLGIALSFGVIQMINMLAAGMSGRHEAVFTYHPFIFAVTILAAFLTVFLSAWLPAGKLSRLTPLAAIQNSGELQLKKKKSSRTFSILFGIEGELAGNALKAQKKALRTSTLSLTFSFLGFTLMLCFFTLSGISTNHTYFEKYQDAWDIMITVKDTDIENFALAEEISNDNTSNMIYQKAAALSVIPETNISDKVNESGGLERIAGSSVHKTEGFYDIPSPVIIMDDNSFMEYCRQIGIEPDTTGSIVLNQIWDSINSNFRYKEYIPYLSEEQKAITLQNKSQPDNAVTIPVLSFTQKAPLLREEYAHYALVQFIPLSVWKQIDNVIGNVGADTYIRVLAKENRTLSELNLLEEKLSEIVGKRYPFEIENRIQEKSDNDNTLKGYMLIIGSLCVLLAVIGLANVFSNTLGFIRQRKREFARYLSVGMTPKGMKKMFFLEALVIAGRPILVTFPITVLSVGFMIAASHLNPMEFLAKAPIIPIMLFCLAIFGFVALAYYIGGKKIMESSLIEALKNDYIA